MNEFFNGLMNLMNKKTNPSDKTIANEVSEFLSAMQDPKASSFQKLSEFKDVAGSVMNLFKQTSANQASSVSEKEINEKIESMFKDNNMKEKAKSFASHVVQVAKSPLGMMAISALSNFFKNNQNQASVQQTSSDKKDNIV